ncbi:TNF receptor-associated factor family protein [Acrasis kona]|uniref:TNF receptor-associated factor family protein n=1 Tax=Acrasis kona TaxID=1008807 RepID=A0AAW2ZGN9_9EUKA
MGIPDFVFVGSVPHYYRCSLCNQVADLPVQCPSCLDDIYCNRCFREHTKALQLNVSACPKSVCMNTWSYPNDVRVNKRIHLFIMNLPARCAIVECPETGTLQQTIEHFKNCRHKIVKCPHHSKGCKEIPMLKDLDSHLKTDCDFNLQTCELCSERMSSKKLAEHLNTTCPNKNEKCKFGCGKTINISEVQQHENVECDMVKICCKYSLLGCNWTDCRGRLEEHLENSCSYHKVRGLISKMQNENQKLRSTLEVTDTTRKDLEKKVINLTVQLKKKRRRSEGDDDFSLDNKKKPKAGRKSWSSQPHPDKAQTPTDQNGVIKRKRGRPAKNANIHNNTSQ